jgi:anti-sigma B factor antagonist
VAELSLDVHLNGDGHTVVIVQGEIDMATAPQLAGCLADHADHDVVVDLSGVPFLDSSALSVLVHARKTIAESGHILRVTGEQDNVRTVLEVTGLLATLHGDDGLAAD